MDSIVSNPPHSAPRSSAPPSEMTLNKPQRAIDESFRGPAPTASKGHVATANREDKPSTVRRTPRSTAVLPTMTGRTSDPQQSHRAAIGHAFNGKSRGGQAGYPGQRPAQARSTVRPPDRCRSFVPLVAARLPTAIRSLSASQRTCRKRAYGRAALAQLVRRRAGAEKVAGSSPAGVPFPLASPRSGSLSDGPHSDEPSCTHSSTTRPDAVAAVVTSHSRRTRRQASGDPRSHARPSHTCAQSQPA